ncbi:MAG: hypothetical protein CL916_11425 [Deltaproteobacteria bacterium]|nr:hypothetical protein [Deltaproteobacteria bacterium]
MIFGCFFEEEKEREVQSFSRVRNLVDDISLQLFTKDIFENWYASRGVVLQQKDVCAVHSRHVFIDVNGTTVSYIDDTKDKEGRNTTQRTINVMRTKLWEEKRTDIVQASAGSTSYPFVYSCTHNVYEQALHRVTGKEEESLLYGSWKQFHVSKESPISIVEAIFQMNEQNRHQVPEDIIKRLLGQLVIESSGKKNATSIAGARGMLQIMPETLKSCGIEPKHYQHRFAQIDCALSELKSAHRALHTLVYDVLSDLSDKQRDDIAAWMTTQAYHAGRGNISKLFTTHSDVATSINSKADFFSEFSGKDLSMILILKNFGRASIGPQALKYALDSEIVGDQILLLTSSGR